MKQSDGLKGQKVRAKMRELCEEILAGHQYRTANEALETFLANDEAKAAFLSYSDKQAELQERERRGFQLSAGELHEIEQLRKAAEAIPEVVRYQEATDALAAIRLGMLSFLNKSFELGNVPEDGDFGEED